MAAHDRRVGLQPARPDRPRECRRPAHGVVARAHRRVPVGHAARLPRGALHAQPRRRHPGHRRRRPATSSGSTGATCPTTSASTCWAPSRPTTATSPSTTGSSSTPAPTPTSSPSTPRPARWCGRPQVLDYRVHSAMQGAGPIIAGREGRLGPELPAAGRARGVRGRRARRPDGRRGVAAAAHPGARRARRRELGRRAVRGALARRRLDGPELRPRAEPRLPRDVGHLARAQVHARRGRQPAPIPQLDAGPRRRHRRDPLVLPAPERPLGPRPSLRAHPRRHRRGPRPVAGELDQPAAAGRRDAPASSPASPARPASSTPSTARPASSCGPRRRCSRTSSAASTARPAR